jgi:hypothetical protein
LVICPQQSFGRAATRPVDWHLFAAKYYPKSPEIGTIEAVVGLR